MASHMHGAACAAVSPEGSHQCRLACFRVRARVRARIRVRGRVGVWVRVGSGVIDKVRKG